MVQYRLPLHEEAVEMDCSPTMMGGRLVRMVVGSTRYPNGLEHDEVKRDDILLQSRAAMVVNNFDYRQAGMDCTSVMAAV